MSAAPVIVVLTQRGADLARRIQPVAPDAEIHGLAARVTGVERRFESVSEHLQALFRAGTPIVGVCAAGILIRALAPVIAAKDDEPPVIAVAEDGSAVVPLLGGHRGANDLAAYIAEALDVAPAVTTAGALRFGVALDAPPAGWVLANPEDYKRFAADLLVAGAVSVEGAAPWLADSRLPLTDDTALRIVVTERAVAGSHTRLVYHPRTLALGVGCERGVAPDDLVAHARGTLRAAGLAEAAVAVVVSVDLKADEAAVHAVGEALGAPVRFFDAARLEAETPRLANPSSAVFREVGCHGVAEGAALAAAGPDGDLIVPKATGARVTCAVARATEPIDTASVGRPRGRLAVVGIGPGTAEWRTPEAETAITAAAHVVGYHGYLDLLGPALAGKVGHGFALGEEEARVRAALDLAAAGDSVALVSSGDPGIYAMAALVFELLEREGRSDWRRCAVTVVPGISALQAAAARIGAPIGHDFCAISLSDLLTPWPRIAARIEAAAVGDFVIAFYNPVSSRRRTQLAEARDILLKERAPDTPVVLARAVGRPEEAVRVTTLAALSPDDADMLTVVLIGASDSRVIETADGPRVYTPRGYAAKPGKAVRA